MALILNPCFEDTFEVLPIRRRRSLWPLDTCCSPPRRYRRYHPFRTNILNSLQSYSNNFGLDETKNTDSSFETFLDLRGYDPKEVEVTLDPTSRMIVVKGSKAEKTVCGVFQKHFQRSLALPESCQLDQVKTFLNRDGMLKITVPRVQEALEHKAKEEEKKKEGAQKIQVGKETIEVEDIPEVGHGDKEEERMSNPDVILEEKSEGEKMDEIEKEKENPTDEVQKLPIEVEKEYERFDERDEKMEVEDEAFNFQMDINDFNPKDISVEMDTRRGVLSVRAASKVEKENGTFFMKEMQRDVKIDVEKFDLNKLNCSVDVEANILSISAPKKLLAVINETKTIPITFKH